MTRQQYEELQEQLTQKANNNPYGKRGLFNYERGYQEGLLAAKSIVSRFYHENCEKEEAAR